MLPRCLQIAVEALHEAVVLLVPDEELENDADAVEAGLRSERQLLVRGFEALLEALLLPLIDPVCAVAAHEVAAAQPVVLVVPGPGALPAPDFTHAMIRLPFLVSPEDGQSVQIHLHLLYGLPGKFATGPAEKVNI